MDDEQRQTGARGVARMAWWLDTAFEIPVLGVRFGWDAILGLIPGVGDVASSLASLYILTASHQLGVPRVTIARMALNTGLDLAIGAIPVVGDLFDVYWKSNQRNVELLQRRLAAGPAVARRNRLADSAFVMGIAVVLVALLIAAGGLAYFLVVWLWAVLDRMLG